MEKTTKALAGAALLFGSPMDADQLRAYLAVLGSSGASDHRLALGVQAACRVCKFMPRPADVLENLPTVETARKYLPAPDDEYIPPEDMAFARVALPLLLQYAAKKITRDSYLGQLRWEAKKAGVEGKINWDEFGPDAPWNPAGRQA